MKEFSLNQVTIKDNFWNYYQSLMVSTTIPYQYDVMNDSIDVEVQAERKDDALPTGKSHALENLRIAAGLKNGEHFGWFFQDSDVYKWLEAVGNALNFKYDAQLKNLADDVIDLIALAQEEDGYINSYFQIKFPKLKYRQLYFSHELYCAGHLIEAAISYAKATSDRKLLNVAIKFVENIKKHFGTEDGKIKGADGHQEIELALVKLYEFTNDTQYLDLAEFFVKIRGRDIKFYDKQVEVNKKLGLSMDDPKIDLVYLQADCSIENQTYAKGHAVRMLYMACGMAKVAQYTNDSTLKQNCIKIWEDITRHKMFVTGGVGSTVFGEAFVGEYDLPNDTMYCETCAGIALVNFCFELFKLTTDFKYIDTLERALYNVVLSGASIDGKHFFYVNPLEIHCDSCINNPGKGHVKTKRPDWLGCACCPPNFARTISSLQRYIYCSGKDELWVNLFIPSIVNEKEYQLVVEGDFPYTDTLLIKYTGPNKKLYLRKPYWLKSISIETNSKYSVFSNYIEFNVSDLEEIRVTLNQEIQIIQANPAILSTINSCVIQRGPFIYCIEDMDQNKWVHNCRITPQMFKAKSFIDQRVINRTMVIEFRGYAAENWQNLYSDNSIKLDEVKWYAIPYHLWGNRRENDMRVWLPLAFVT